MRMLTRRASLSFLIIFAITAAAMLFLALPSPVRADIAANGKVVIVLDAGHGGIDGGTAVGTLTEKEINLRLAKYLRAVLEGDERFEVWLTREEDVYLNFFERVSVAHEHNADLLLSLHCNSSPEADANGCLSIVSVVKKFQADEIAGRILDNISASVPIRRGRVDTEEDTGDELGIYYWSEERQWDMPGAYELGQKSDYYSINTWSSRFGIPSAIIEHGYLSNANDDAVLSDDASLWAIAAAEGRAIIDYYTGHEHVFGEVETDFPSNCILHGTASARCTICGAKSGTVDLPETPGNHWWRYLEHTPATCTEEGYMRAVCEIERTFSRQVDEIRSEVVEEVLPALGHDYAVIEEIPAKHGQDGLLRKRCTVCGDETEEVTPAEPHEYAVIEEVPAECAADGRLTERCTICGDVKTTTLPALGHDYEVEKHVDPTYEEDGYEILVCARCGDEKTEVLSVCPHEFDTTEDPPTCTVPGRRTSTCRLCGYVKIEELPAPGHRYETQMEVDPSCTEEGFYRGKCAVCGDVTSERTPPLGHHLIANPDGRGQICTICGEHVGDEGASEVPVFKNPLVIVILLVVAAQLLAVIALLVRSRMEEKKKRRYR